MNTVNKDMRDAEKNLAGLEKCCGLCACPWQKVNPEKVAPKKLANFFRGRRLLKTTSTNGSGRKTKTEKSSQASR